MSFLDKIKYFGRWRLDSHLEEINLNLSDYNLN